MRAQDKIELPESLPIFPLTGVLLLPRGNLPLNIFEERYLNMVDDALRTDRIIGMIQPKEYGMSEIFETGCAGRIRAFEETNDGRYLISLEGISRFHIQKEVETIHGYRRIIPDWSAFENDLTPTGCLDIDKEALLGLLKTYFDKEGLSCDWDAVTDCEDENLMTALAMICPLEAKEKQVLLETNCCKERAQTFMTMLKIAINGSENPTQTHH